MRKFLLLVLTLTICVIGLSAQSASGRYNSRMTRDGTLYFINPYKLKEKENISSFEYDMTCLTWSDSVTVNFTYVSKSMDLPENLRIESGTVSYPCTDYSPLYIDIVGKGYEIRITSKFPVREILEVIERAAAPGFVFDQAGIQRSAFYTESAWRKDRKKLQDIFTLYKYTK